MYKLTISLFGRFSLATLRAISHLLAKIYISNASTGYPAFIKYFSAKSYYLISA